MDNNIKENDKMNNTKLIAGAILIVGVLIAGAILMNGKSPMGQKNSDDKKLPKEFSQCLDSGKYTEAVTSATAKASEQGVKGTPKSFILVDGKVVSTVDGAYPLADVTKKLDDALAGKSAPLKDTQIDPVTAADHSLGEANSKVVMVEYADYQCPFCGRFFTNTVEPVIEKYVKTGKIQYVYRDFAFLGKESTKSAEATLCANDQGKYWEFHNYLFTHQNGENEGNFSDTNLKKIAAELGLK